jgi:hypothetical protein
MSSTGANQLTSFWAVRGTTAVFYAFASLYSDSTERLGFFACARILSSTPGVKLCTELGS